MSAVIQWGIWLVLMTVIMGWLARSRTRVAAAADGNEIKHPRSIFIVGLVGFLFFFAIAIISNVFGNGTETWWTTAIFIGFALLNGLLIADFYLARHRLIEGGLEYGRLFGRRGTIGWNEVTRIHYSPSMKWFRIEAGTGRVARISAMMTGLPEFAKAVLAHVPQSAIAAPTYNVLYQTSEGNPPPIWSA
jgi:hypothetical protein